MDALYRQSDVREWRVLVQGLPYLTATVTYSLWGPTGTLLLDAVPATHIGAGWYRVALDGPTHLGALGLYREVWSGTAGDAVLYHREAFTCGDARGPLLTRLEIRHEVAFALQDKTLGQVQAATATTLTDPARIETAGAWRGADCAIYAGSGRDQARTVQTSSVGQLAIVPTWAAPAPGDLYELHQRHPTADYNAAINKAIVQGAHYRLIPYADESLLLGTGAEVEIPAGLAWISAVEVLSGTDTGTGAWRRLDPRYYDWAVVPGRRLLRLRVGGQGTRLRLIGEMLPSLLVRDASYCDLPADYVIAQAAANLLAPQAGGTLTDPSQTAIKLKYYQDLAAAALPKRGPAHGSRRVS